MSGLAMHDLGYLTAEEAWELNDSLNETIERMLCEGMSEAEVGHDSLRVMWGLQKRILLMRTPGPLPGWALDRDNAVEAMMAAPRIVKRQRGLVRHP